jgi:2-phosphoglycerate kinase
VLLIGGVSGSGKSTVARELGRRLAIPWIGVDDLRLAFQWSRVSLPDPKQTEALCLFYDRPDVWALAPERLQDGLINVGELMLPAFEVVGHHLDHTGPRIIEGDGIVPGIVERPEVRRGFEEGRVGVVFIDEQSVDRLDENYRERQRGPVDRPGAELRAEARVKALFSLWLAREAGRHGLSMIPSRPFASLPDRIMTAVEESG